MEVVRQPPRTGQLRATPANPLEAGIARRFDARRAEALDRAARAFGGFDVGLMAATTDGAPFALLDVAPEVAEALASEQLWARYFDSQDGSQPRFRIVPGGGGPPAATTAELVRPALNEAEIDVPLPGAAADALHDGSTIILNRLDLLSTGALRDLSEDLEASFGIVASTNCYLSRGAARGFGRHWDDHDVLIVQVQGRKLWEVFEPTHLSPHRNYVPEDLAGRASWSGILEPGRALHIPRGWAHRVVSLEEVSIHYTIAVQRPTFLDLLGMAAPPDGPADLGALATSLARALGDGPQAAAATRAAYRAEVPTRPRCDPLAIDRWHGAPVPDALELLTTQGGASFTDVDHGVGLRWSGCDLVLTDDEAALLAAWPAASGDAQAAEAATVAFGRELLRHGLARPRAVAP